MFYCSLSLKYSDCPPLKTRCRPLEICQQIGLSIHYVSLYISKEYQYSSQPPLLMVAMPFYLDHVILTILLATILDQAIMSTGWDRLEQLAPDDLQYLVITLLMEKVLYTKSDTINFLIRRTKYENLVLYIFLYMFFSSWHNRRLWKTHFVNIWHCIGHFAILTCLLGAVMVINAR